MQLLSVTNLSVERGGKRLFMPINFSLTAGELVWIKGLNGSGKTSLLLVLAGLASYHLYDGMAQNAVIERFTSEVAFLGHQEALHPHLSVLENITLLAAIAGRAHDALSLKMYLSLANLQDYVHCNLATLSRGQIKRVALVGLLLQEAKLWVLDEPLVNLDKDGSAWVIRMLQWHLSNGGGIILTTHQDLLSFTLDKNKNVIHMVNLVEAFCVSA